MPYHCARSHFLKDRLWGVLSWGGSCPGGGLVPGGCLDLGGSGPQGGVWSGGLVPGGGGSGPRGVWSWGVWSWGGLVPGGLVLERSGPRVGVWPRGVWPQGVSGPGGSGPKGVLVPGGIPSCTEADPPLWTEFLTHACENITLATTKLRPVINE